MAFFTLVTCPLLDFNKLIKLVIQFATVDFGNVFQNLSKFLHPSLAEQELGGLHIEIEGKAKGNPSTASDHCEFSPRSDEVANENEGAFST